ncbi:MAG: endonuclease V [Smithella sp.]
MILAVDVFYYEDKGNIGGVVFENWSDAKPIVELTVKIDNIAKYESGSFYKRELPCILKLIEDHSLYPEFIIIDGYVFIDGFSKPGLGFYLYNSLYCKTPVIGVAKSYFKGIPPYCELLRGNSKRPLFITSIGINLELAKEYISKMHGKNRIPSLLKSVDQLSRKIS